MTRTTNTPVLSRNVSANWTKAALVLAVSFAASTVGVKAQNSLKVGARLVSKSGRRVAQFGKATWYGGRFNGHRTATGERYDMRAMTCAHRTLPFGTWLRVTNVKNRKAVFVRVNDRGPVSENILIDLSFAAAQRIGINGVGKVEAEAVRSNDPALLEYLRPKTNIPTSYLQFASNSDGIPLLAPNVAFR